jgi:hypothetical protein
MYVAESMTLAQSSRIPAVFTSVPLQRVMLLVDVFLDPPPDTVDFANKTALLWAQSVLTLNHTIMDVIAGSGMGPSDQEKYGWEVTHAKDGRVDLRSITSNEVDKMREGYNLWE